MNFLRSVEMAEVKVVPTSQPCVLFAPVFDSLSQVGQIWVLWGDQPVLCSGGTSVKGRAWLRKKVWGAGKHEMGIKISQVLQSPTTSPHAGTQRLTFSSPSGFFWPQAVGSRLLCCFGLKGRCDVSSTNRQQGSLEWDPWKKMFPAVVWTFHGHLI